MAKNKIVPPQSYFEIVEAVPDITLESVKIKNHMTTQIFADRVNRRYQRCIAAK